MGLLEELRRQNAGKQHPLKGAASGRSNVRLQGRSGDELCYREGVTGGAGGRRQESLQRMGT